MRPNIAFLCQGLEHPIRLNGLESCEPRIIQNALYTFISGLKMALKLKMLTAYAHTKLDDE